MGSPKKSGFTLVEILVAATVLSLALVVGYRVFVSFSRSFQKGSWSLASQNKLRNALTFIREEMQKATPLSEVSMGGAKVTTDGYEFNLTPADELTGNGEIANWHICLPFVTGDADSPGAVFKCELKLENGKILYTKTMLPGGSDPNNNEQTYNDRKVIEDVASITIGLAPFDNDIPDSGSMITLIVQVEHPDKINYESAHVTAETAAKVEVKVVR
ncbi:MAG TPA: hypothetical protein DCG57_19115 [Candidatus Riflebacteria bacterium]|jgi:prepilin-type N-terminal cleavage/methylation domain-containing protein|nr:hypothetical protein [Candidatus Riflebacteria bacterium]